MVQSCFPTRTQGLKVSLELNSNNAKRFVPSPLESLTLTNVPSTGFGIASLSATVSTIMSGSVSMLNPSAKKLTCCQKSATLNASLQISVNMEFPNPSIPSKL